MWTGVVRLDKLQAGIGGFYPFRVYHPTTIGSIPTHVQLRLSGREWSQLGLVAPKAHIFRHWLILSGPKAFWKDNGPYMRLRRPPGPALAGQAS